MAFIVTRINVGNYEMWKTMFGKDEPGARSAATGHRILRGVENPGEVLIVIEFPSAEDAEAGREKLVAYGVLDRFPDKDIPKVVEEAEAITPWATRSCPLPADRLQPRIHQAPSGLR